MGIQSRILDSSSAAAGGAEQPSKQRRENMRETIRARAFAVGFEAIGFTKPVLALEARRNLASFLAKGYHGDMGWLEKEVRFSPQKLWPPAKSVICLGRNYAPSADPLQTLNQPTHGSVSVYARGLDYHKVLKRDLSALGRWIGARYRAQVRMFVDTAPLMEKPLAQKAGIGWQGKHTNVVSRRFGSWLFLGELLTDLALEADEEARNLCGSCTRCLDSCPTKAFLGPYKLNARRCISYLTIEHKGPIQRDLRALMGNRIYGCDDCLAVCPWNKFASVAASCDFVARSDLQAPSLLTLSELDDAAFRRRFAGSPIKRTGRDRFLRNVVIALGNTRTHNLSPSLRRRVYQAVYERLLDDSGLVRGAAVWAFWRLASAEDFLRVAGALASREEDADVQEEWRQGVASGSRERNCGKNAPPST